MSKFPVEIPTPEVGTLWWMPKATFFCQFSCAWQSHEPANGHWNTTNVVARLLGHHFQDNFDDNLWRSAKGQLAQYRFIYRLLQLATVDYIILNRPRSAFSSAQQTQWFHHFSQALTAVSRPTLLRFKSSKMSTWRCKSQNQRAPELSISYFWYMMTDIANVSPLLTIFKPPITIHYPTQQYQPPDHTKTRPKNPDSATDEHKRTKE